MRQQAEDRQKAAVGAAGVVLSSVTDAPDQVAGDLKLANEFGKVTGNPVPPAPMVKEYRPMFQQEIERRNAAAVLADAPTLTDFIRNPENAALARDDLSALSAWDRIGKSFKMGEAKMITNGQDLSRDLEGVLQRSAVGRGLDTVQDAFDSALLTNEDGTPNFMGRLANWARSQGGMDGVPVQMVGGPDVTPEQRSAAAFAQNFDTLYRGSKLLLAKMEKEGFNVMSYKDVNGIGSFLSFVAENIAMSAPQMGTAMASGGFQPLIQILGMGGEVNEELKKRVKDMSPEARVSVAVGAGSAMAALEMFGLSKIFGAVTPSKVSSAGSAAADIAAEAIEGTLVKRVLTNGGSEAMGRLLTAAIAEGSTEALQEAIKMGVTSLSGGKYKAEEVIEGVIGSFTAGAAAGGGMRAGVEGMRSVGKLAEGRKKAEGAAKTAETVADIAANAMASKLRERMPDRFREVAAKALEGSSVENMFVPAEAAQAYFQSVGFDIYALEGFDGITREDIDAAIEAGGDIKIPTATYAAHIAGSEHDAFFQANAKFDPNAMSAQEAAAFNERVAEIQQEMWEEAEAIRRDDETLRSVETQIYDTMVSRLRAGNQSTEAATTNAMMVAAFYKAQAERQGKALEDYLRDHPLPEIQGARPEGVQFRDIDQINRTLTELRARSGKAKTTSPLLDFIRERGGIDDVGGELAARNADAARKPGQRSLARKLTKDGKPRPLTAQEQAEGRRYGWDDTAQAAVEAGLLKDHPLVAEWMAAQEKGDRVAPDLIPVLMEAIDAELNGGVKSEADATMDQIEEYLASLGADLSMPDDQVRALIERDQDGRKYAQSEQDRGGRSAPVTLVDPNTAVPVLELSGLPSRTHAEAQAALKGVAGQYKTASGEAVAITANATRKALSKNANETKRSLVGEFGNVLSNAVVYGEAGDFSYAVAHVRLEGADVAVRLALKRVADGSSRLYQLEGFEVDRQAISVPVTDNPRARPASAQLSVGELVEIFNSQPQGQFPLFQKEGMTRGSFQMRGDGTSIISLFQSANLSTVQHELGHLFLTYMQQDALQGVPEAAAEYEAIKGWWRDNAAAVAADGVRAMPDVALTAADVQMAIDTGSTGDMMKDAAIDIGMQEQFARGYEAYLMEGKAPSLDLKTVFSKLSAWMVSVYKRLRGLNVQMSDDIRGVFDRMLATDEEIQAARNSSGEGGPVFATAEMMGLTEEEYGRYLKLRDQAEAEARGRLLAEVMEPIKRQREQWWQEERDAVKAEVTADFQSQPLFTAIQELRFGKGFNGEETGTPKLDRGAIERDFGAGYLPYLPGATKDGKGHRNAVFANEGGMHPDIVAGIFGYPSGRDLLDALVNAPALNEAIEAETARIMDERHGDALNDGEIELIALDAVHSDKRTEWIAAELKAVSEVAGVEVGLTAKEAKIVARETLDKMSVKDASASHRFLAAERKAAGEAETLARALGREGVWQQNARRKIATKARGAVRGDNTVNAVAGQIDQANASVGNYNETVQRFIAAKRRQLQNHALYMESRKSREFVQKVEDKAAKLNRTDKQLGQRRDIDYIKAARAVASKFALAAPETDFDVSMWFEQLKADDPVSFSAIQDAIVTYTQNAMPYKQMSLSQFGALNDAIDSLLETGKRFKDIEIEGKKVDKAAAIEELNDVLEGRGLKRNPALDRELSKGEKRVRTIMGWASSLRRVEAWARAMDDGKQGVYTRYLVRPVMDALDSYRVAKEDKLGKLLKIIEARKDTLTGAAITAPELNGYTFTNKASLIHAILHTGNQSNFEKLLLGRGWSAGFVNQKQDVTKLGKPRFRRDGSPVMTKGDLDTSKWDAFLDRKINDGTITSEDIDMVNSIWDLMEEIKRPAQAAHKKVFGFYFKEIEGAGYDTKAGRLKGGYVPAILDKDASNDGLLREGETALDQQSAGFMLPTAGSGFTKSRVQNYTQPLAMDLTLLPAHMDKVLRFTHLDPAVRQTHSLIVDRRFGNTLSQYDPTLVDNLLLPWLQRVAQQSIDAPAGSSAGRSFNNVLRGLRKRVGFNTMFANLVNVTQQVTGLSVAATIIKPSHLKDATARFARDMDGSRAEVFAASPFMRERIKNATRETQMRIQDVVKEPSTYNDFQQWIEKHGYFMQQAVQNWIDVPVWMAAYDQAVANGMTDKDAVFEADAAIRRTMVGMNPEDVSMFESGSILKRLFTMFYTYFNGQANHLAQEGSTIWRQQGWGGSGKLFYLYLFGIMVPAVGAEMIAQAARGELGDDDEDGKYWDDLLATFFGSQVKYGTAMVPVGGQLLQLVFNQFNDKSFDDKLSNPAVGTIERAARAPVSIGKAVMGDGKASVAVGDGITAFALATGLPLNWLAKPLGYAAGVAEGKSKPTGVVDVLQGVVSGRDGTEKK